MKTLKTAEMFARQDEIRQEAEREIATALDPMTHDYIQPANQPITSPCQKCGHDIEHHRDRHEYRFSRHAGWYKPGVA